METRPHLYRGDRHMPNDWDLHRIMYEVPGFGEPNIERYILSREENQDELERITLKSRFEAAETLDRQNLVQEALSSPDIRMQRAGAELVQHLDINQRADLQQILDQNVIRALSSEELGERDVSAQMVQYTSGAVNDGVLKLMKSTIDEYLRDKSILVQETGARMITALPDYGEKRNYQDLLYNHVQAQILSGESGAQMDAVKLFPYLHEEKLPSIISFILDGENAEVKIVVAEYIKRLPERAAIPLLRRVFGLEDLVLKQIAADAVTKLFRIHDKQPDIPSDIAEAVSNTTARALSSDDIETQRIGSEMLKDVPEATKLIEFIEVGMSSKDIQVRVTAIKAIRYMSSSTETYKTKMKELILLALESEDGEIQKAAIATARHVPEPEKTECMEVAFKLVSSLLRSNDREKQKHAATMAYHTSHPQMEELFRIIEKDQELLETLFFSRLYPERVDISGQESTKQHKKVPFLKTGSEMTVLRGGPLERKLIVRHIKKSAFIGWMKAFEENETWLEHGFDYVPVEPIQSFSFSRKRADVCSGVLDIDLKHWISISGGRFEDELKNKRREIISVLEDLGIRHSDLHEGNFFLKFPRQADGTINTQLCPRVYVGDFDKSKLKTKLKARK